jgi:hypothetical protein
VVPESLRVISGCCALTERVYYKHLFRAGIWESMGFIGNFIVPARYHPGGRRMLEPNIPYWVGDDDFWQERGFDWYNPETGHGRLSDRRF